MSPEHQEGHPQPQLAKCQVDARKDNLEFFQEQLPKLLRDPLFTGKYVVIHGKSIKGAFDNFENAVRYAAEHLPSGEFIIQRVVDEAEVINFVRVAG